MVTPAAYPCPTCAAPLRFQADDNAWACDACRVVYPVQAAGAPPAPLPVPLPIPLPAPIYAPPPPVPGPAGASSAKKKIAIVAGTGALGLGLIATLVIALGGGRSGGKASAREVVEATVDRATAGDLDGLVALTLVPRIADVADCDSDRSLDERRAVRATLRDQLDHWKGLHVTVTSVEEDGSPDVKRAGRREMGCKLDHELAHQRLRVHIHAKADGGGEDDEEVLIRATHLGEGWYLDELHDAPSIGVLGKLRAVKDKICACKDRACLDPLQSELDDARREAMRAAHELDQEHQVTELDMAAMQCQEQVRAREYDTYP